MADWMGAAPGGWTGVTLGNSGTWGDGSGKTWTSQYMATHDQATNARIGQQEASAWSADRPENAWTQPTQGASFADPTFQNSTVGGASASFWKPPEGAQTSLNLQQDASGYWFNANYPGNDQSQGVGAIGQPPQSQVTQNPTQVDLSAQMQVQSSQMPAFDDTPSNVPYNWSSHSGLVQDPSGKWVTPEYLSAQQSIPTAYQPTADNLAKRAATTAEVEGWKTQNAQTQLNLQQDASGNWFSKNDTSGNTDTWGNLDASQQQYRADIINGVNRGSRLDSSILSPEEMKIGQAKLDADKYAAEHSQDPKPFDFTQWNYNGTQYDEKAYLAAKQYLLNEKLKQAGYSKSYTDLYKDAYSTDALDVGKINEYLKLNPMSAVDMSSIERKAGVLGPSVTLPNGSVIPRSKLLQSKYLEKSDGTIVPLNVALNTGYVPTTDGKAIRYSEAKTNYVKVGNESGTSGLYQNKEDFAKSQIDNLQSSISYVKDLYSNITSASANGDYSKVLDNFDFYQLYNNNPNVVAANIASATNPVQGVGWNEGSAAPGAIWSNYRNTMNSYGNKGYNDFLSQLTAATGFKSELAVPTNMYGVRGQADVRAIQALESEFKKYMLDSSKPKKIDTNAIMNMVSGTLPVFNQQQVSTSDKIGSSVRNNIFNSSNAIANNYNSAEVRKGGGFFSGMLGPLSTMVSIAFPAAAPFIQGAMAAYNASQGNYGAAALGALGAYNSFTGTNVGGDFVKSTAGDMGFNLSQSQSNMLANVAGKTIGGLVDGREFDFGALATNLGTGFISNQLGSYGETPEMSQFISNMSNGVLNSLVKDQGVDVSKFGPLLYQSVLNSASRQPT